MHRRLARYLVVAVFGWTALICFGTSAIANTITGDPSADGWTFNGNSTANGTYIRSNPSRDFDHAFDIYTTLFTVTDPSVFSLDGHFGNPAYEDFYVTGNGNPWDQSTAREWEVGHTVIGIGGVFQTLTAAEAGWTEFQNTTINQNNLENEFRFRLIAKIGTEDATWFASTEAPGDGNGNGSTANGGVGALFLTTSGWNSLTTWENLSGEVLGIRSVGHLSVENESPSFTIGPDVARLVWTWDDEANRVGTWELLINISLVEQDYDSAGFTGPLPGQPGNKVVASVQVSSNQYTDGLAFIPTAVAPVPEPGTLVLALFGLAAGGAARLRRRS